MAVFGRGVDVEQGFVRPFVVTAPADGTFQVGEDVTDDHELVGEEAAWLSGKAEAWADLDCCPRSAVGLGQLVPDRSGVAPAGVVVAAQWVDLMVEPLDDMD
ncbi:hypothetical protein [Streptomyces mirabilis]